MTLALNNELTDGKAKIYRRTVARLMCVNGIYTSKARFITIKQLDRKKPPKIYYTETSMPLNLMKNGVLILPKKRFQEQIKRFISVLSLIYMTDFLLDML